MPTSGGHPSCALPQSKSKGGGGSGHSLVSIVNHQIVGFSKKQRSVVNSVLTWMKPTMARERRAIGKSILEKKKWLKEQLSGLFITKSLNLQAEECTFKHFHAPQYRNCLRRGTKYSKVHVGKIWKWEKNTIFLSPINFLQVFLSQVAKKTWPEGKILYCFSSSSYPRSCLGRKVK